MSLRRGSSPDRPHPHQRLPAGERRGPGRPWAERALPAAEPASSGKYRVVTGSGSRASRRRKVAHGFVGAASWAGFAWLWVVQVTVHLPSEWARDLVGMAGTLALFTVLTLGWVRWNRNIYRRRHRRKAPLVQAVSFVQDTQGRTIVAPPELRERSGEIVVSLTGPELGVKRYIPRCAVEDEPPRELDRGAVA